MVPGIGKRTAEKLIVELQGKLSSLNFSTLVEGEQKNFKTTSPTKLQSELFR